MSRRDPLAAVERLTLESLELLTLVHGLGVGESTRCLDVGSGGGFPGLVWALAEPTWTFVLVERKAGRAAFLQAEVLRLSLSRVDVLAESLERVVASRHLEPGFDLAVAMAVDTPDRLGPGLEAVLCDGGVFACTSPTASQPPPRVGISLDLEVLTPGDYGNFVFYRRHGTRG